jgi:hypothetical protein
MPRKLYSFWIDKRLATGLKRIKKRDGMPESEQIRRAVDQWLRSKGAIKRRSKEGRQ